MQTYLIGYDLNRPGQNYSALYDEIKRIANGWWHNLDSTWLVNSSSSAGKIRDALWAHMDANDKLLVIDVGPNWATAGMPDNANAWLRENLKIAKVA